MQLIDVSAPKVMVGTAEFDLAELAIRTEDKLRRFISKRVMNAADVEDLMQVTYLEAWRNQHKFLGESRAETWLFGIAANVISNHFRRLYSRPLHVDWEVSGVEGVEGGQDPSQCSDFQRQLGRVVSAMEFLSADMRAVMDLVIHDDVSYQEAAHMLGVPIGTVRSRLARAREQLKVCVAALESERPERAAAKLHGKL